jgi:hypothetical protein
VSKNWQIVTKRERERLVEQKRTLKRERKRAMAAAKAAIKRGEEPPESPFLPSVDESEQPEILSDSAPAAEQPEPPAES